MSCTFWNCRTYFFLLFSFATSPSLYRFPLVSSIRSLSSMRRAFYERNFPNENKTWANKMCLGEKRFRYTFLRMKRAWMRTRRNYWTRNSMLCKTENVKKKKFATLCKTWCSFSYFFSVPINVVLEMEAVWNSNWALTVLHSINYCLSQIFMYQTNRACVWVCL